MTVQKIIAGSVVRSFQKYVADNLEEIKKWS